MSYIAAMSHIYSLPVRPKRSMGTIRMGKRPVKESVPEDTTEDDIRTILDKLVIELDEEQTAHESVVSTAQAIVDFYEQDTSIKSRSMDRTTLQDILVLLKNFRNRTDQKRSLGAMRLGKRSISVGRNGRKISEDANLLSSTKNLINKVQDNQSKQQKILASAEAIVNLFTESLYQPATVASSGTGSIGILTMLENLE